MTFNAPFDANEAQREIAMCIAAGAPRFDALFQRTRTSYVNEDMAYDIMRDVLLHDDDELATFVANDDDLAYVIDDALRGVYVDDDERRASLYATYVDDVRTFATRIAHVFALMNDRHMRDVVSLLRYDASLCPMHACDYAICFDDDDVECAAIRDVLPNHDT